MASTSFAVSARILKFDAPLQIVYGWANHVATESGALIEDSQGDLIPPEELEKAAVEYMLASRASGVMHEGLTVGQVIACLVTTPEIRKCFDLGDGPVGLIIGVKYDRETYARVVSGELPMFSIQGRAEEIAA